MSRNKGLLSLLMIASLAVLTAPAFAGGPLLVDSATKKAYAYDTSTPVPIYYDLGNLGVVPDYSTDPPTMVTFDNTVGKNLVTKGFGDWAGIKTASFRANVVGDFSTIGLTDIDSSNVTSIIGTVNGRGDYVIFDADGSIMQNFFGVGPNVLGISSPEFAISGTTVITESWTVLNGSAIDPADPGAQNFQGVATHEFGHALGMAHTQTNGAAYLYGWYNAEGVGPNSCGSNLPYTATLTNADVETMYPYVNHYVGGTGLAQANLHTTDTLASFSDLYPGKGWSNNYGTITGKVYDINGKTELTGVNVIARNIADPIVDSTSAITGQMTQGELGPDGSYILHGLKPGARYVVYVDALLAGGFSTPATWFLPGAERFWDGNIKASTKFDPCHYLPITATPGKVTKADITFALTPGAPVLHQLGYGAFVTGLSGDGKVAVGDFNRGGPVFQWNAKNGMMPMNVAGVGGRVSISPNGRYISTNLLDVNADVDLGAYRWDAKNGWLQVKPFGSCGTDADWNMAVSNEGSVFGVAYNTCSDYKAFRGNPSTNNGSVQYKSSFQHPDGTWANSRINEVSADGSIAVGWQEADWGGWLGTVWHNGVPELITDVNGDATSEANAVSADGSIIAGENFDGQYPWDGSGWRRDTNSKNLDYVQALNSDATPLVPYALNGDGSVMVGFSGNPWLSFAPAPFIWTKELGTVNLDDFVKHQGTPMEQWATLYSPGSISQDGTTIAGVGLGFQYYGGWVLDMQKTFVCHIGTLSGKPETISVAFPKAFDQHLADGDTPGRCQ